MTKTLNIDGMTCEHCAARVKRALEELPGVDSAQVDLSQGSATVEMSTSIDNRTFAAAVDNAGYTVAAGE